MATADNPPPSSDHPRPNRQDYVRYATPSSSFSLEEGDPTLNDDDNPPLPVDDDNPLDTYHAPTSLSSSISSFYFQSSPTNLNLIELLTTFGILLGAGLFNWILDPEPYDRPIPVVQLQSTEDFVVNSIFDQEYKGDTIPGSYLIWMSLVIPLAIQLMIAYRRGSPRDCHKTLCVYFAAMGLTILITNLVKTYCGYLRPVFMEFCEPDEFYQECTSGKDAGARKSFPSGHSSLSMCGLLMLSHYLELQFGVSKLRSTFLRDHNSTTTNVRMTNTAGLRTITSIFCYTPVLLAVFCAASRVHDNKHHPADVVGGCLLGGSIATWIFNIWFPSWQTW